MILRCVSLGGILNRACRRPCMWLLSSPHPCVCEYSGAAYVDDLVHLVKLFDRIAAHEQPFDVLSSFGVHSLTDQVPPVHLQVVNMRRYRQKHTRRRKGDER